MLQSETIRKYNTYKDSGIEWIGGIPQEWTVGNLKRLTDFIKNGTSATQVENETEYKVSRIETISTGEINYSKTGYVQYFDNIDDYKLNSNDILFSNINSLEIIGNVAIYDNKEPLYSGMNLLRISVNKNCCPKWLFYVLKNSYFKEQVKANAKHAINQVSISVGRLSQIPIIIPIIEEQQKIANYLDKKCREIDKVVETEKSVIEKLKEYKQSIITEAVTKGLDKSVPLKDSGIEWIGKIPQHWEIIKLKKTISLIADIDHYMPDTTDTGYSYLMTGDLKDIASKIDFENCKHISDSDYKDLSKKIHPVLDDVIFARYATIGTVCYVDIQKDFLVSYSCLTIRPNSEKLFGKFLYYYLISDTFKIEVSQYINSNTQSNVGLDSLQKVYMVLPNKTEQQQIAEYLDKKCSEIDKAIGDKQQVIEKFTEYKKSLIYECVTGKRKVIM